MAEAERHMGARSRPPALPVIPQTGFARLAVRFRPAAPANDNRTPWPKRIRLGILRVVLFAAAAAALGHLVGG